MIMIILINFRLKWFINEKSVICRGGDLENKLLRRKFDCQKNDIAIEIEGIGKDWWEHIILTLRNSYLSQSPILIVTFFNVFKFLSNIISNFDN